MQVIESDYTVHVTERLGFGAEGFEFQTQVVEKKKGHPDHSKSLGHPSLHNKLDIST